MEFSIYCIKLKQEISNLILFERFFTVEFKKMRTTSIFRFLLVLLSTTISLSTHFYGVSLVSDIYIDTNSNTEVIQVFWRFIWNSLSMSSRLTSLFPCNPGPCSTEPWPTSLLMGSGDSCKQSVQSNQVMNWFRISHCNSQC